MKALIITIIAAAMLSAGPAWAESLVDVKVDELSKPTKPRWGKDPFMKAGDRGRPVAEDLGPKNLVVEGIISNGNRAMAIINNGFYRKGDIIDGFVIKDIRTDRVILQRGGKDYTLRMEGFTAAGPEMEDGQ